MTESLVIAIVGAAAGVFATYSAVWATNRFSRRLAAETGSLRKPRIVVRLFGRVINADRGIPTDFWFVHPGGPTDSALAYLDLSFENAGDAPTGDLVVLLTSHRSFLVGDPKFVKGTATPAILQPGFARDSEVRGQRAHVWYTIKSMSPKTGVKFFEPCVFETTSTEMPVDVGLRDGLKGQVTAAVRFAYQFSVTVYPAAEAPVNASASIESVSGESAVDVARAIARRKAAETVAKWNRRPMLQRLSRYALRPWKRREYAVVKFAFDRPNEVNGTLWFVQTAGTEATPSIEMFSMGTKEEVG